MLSTACKYLVTLWSVPLDPNGGLVDNGMSYIFWKLLVIVYLCFSKVWSFSSSLFNPLQFNPFLQLHSGHIIHSRVYPVNDLLCFPRKVRFVVLSSNYGVILKDITFVKHWLLGNVLNTVMILCVVLYKIYIFKRILVFLLAQTCNLSEL